MAWCAGFGRLGGIAGPLIGGLLIAAGLSTSSIFDVLAVLCLLGMVLTVLVPRGLGPRELQSTPIEPSGAVAPAATKTP